MICRTSYIPFLNWSLKITMNSEHVSPLSWQISIIIANEVTGSLSFSINHSSTCPVYPLLRLPQGRNGPDRRAVRIHPPCRGAVRVHASSRVCEQVMHALWQLPCPPHEHFMTSPTTEYVSGSRTLLARGFGRMEKPLHQAVSASASLSVLPCYVQQPAGVHVRPQCTKRIPRTCYDMYSVYLTSAVCYIPHGGPSMAVWCR